METPEATTKLMEITETVLTTGFLLSSVFLFVLARRRPANRKKLTEEMTSRCWSIGQTFLLLMLFIGFSILIPAFRLLPFMVDGELADFFMVLLFSFSQLAAPLCISWKRRQSWGADFGLRWRMLRMLALSIPIYLTVLPVLGMITLYYQGMLEERFGIEVEIQDIAQLISDSRAWIKAGYIALAVIGAPLYEELIFRGVLFPFLVRRIGLPLGTLVLSALFAALHFHLPTLLPLFLLSVTLCLAYWRTGSLWTSIGIHALFNGMTILALSFGI